MDPAPDSWRTLEGESSAEIRIQRSRFLAVAFPAASEGAFEARLGSLRSAHFDATHHCWAFRLLEGRRSRSSDGGEPNGTAGRPILQAVESARLWDAGVVVVRWYGGVKLGTGGLARAYRDAAVAALDRARIVERWIYERFRIATHHRHANLVYRLIDPPGVVLAASAFGEEARFELDVRRSWAERIADELTAARIAFDRG